MASSRRRHGFAYPYDAHQIIAWCLKLAFPLYMYLAVNPLLTGTFLITNHIVFATSFFASIISCIVCTITDPIDPLAERYESSKNGGNQVYEYDRQKTLICSLCDCRILAKSKHCRVCDKCVDVFDHHCAWLNNCVGSRNYRSFFTYLVSLSFSCVWIVFVSVLVLVLSKKSETDFAGLFQIKRANEVFPNMDLDNYCALLGVFAAIAFVALILVGQLLLYHTMFVINNTTTYDYVMGSGEIDFTRTCLKGCKNLATTGSCRTKPPGISTKELTTASTLQNPSKGRNPSPSPSRSSNQAEPPQTPPPKRTSKAHQDGDDGDAGHSLSKTHSPTSQPGKSHTRAATPPNTLPERYLATPSSIDSIATTPAKAPATLHEPAADHDITDSSPLPNPTSRNPRAQKLPPLVIPNKNPDHGGHGRNSKNVPRQISFG